MITGRLRETLAPTDPAIIEVAAGGETFVARMRVLFWGALWLIPSATLLTMPEPPPEVVIGFVAATAAVGIALVLAVVARRYRGRPAVAFTTTTSRS